MEVRLQYPRAMALHGLGLLPDWCDARLSKCFAAQHTTFSSCFAPGIQLSELTAWQLQNNPIRDPGARGRERVPLHQFLRMIAGRAVIGDRANGSNDELVANLRRVGVLSS